MVQVAPSRLDVGRKESRGADWSGTLRPQIALGTARAAGDSSCNKKNSNKMLWGKRFMLKKDNVVALQQGTAAAWQGAKAGRAIGTLQDTDIRGSKGTL